MTTTAQHLAKMIRLVTHGDPTGNPYRHPELMGALRHLSPTGSDGFDLDTAAIVNGDKHPRDALTDAGRLVMRWRDKDGTIGSAKELAAFDALSHALEPGT